MAEGGGGESWRVQARSLSFKQCQQIVLKCNLMKCVDVAPSYLRIRRPINKFRKILFQAVEILIIRIELKS